MKRNKSLAKTNNIVDAELVNPTDKLEKKKKVRKPLNLSVSESYVSRLLNKDVKDLMEFISKQSDALIILNKECALRALEGAAQGDPLAMQWYKDLIATSAMLAHEKAEMFKVLAELGVTDVPQKLPFKAQKMTNEEWEKEFKPGTAMKKAPEQPDLFTGPTPRSVN